MSFDTSQMTYGHLVTYPSVWLPPANTIKVLLLAHKQQQAQDYIAYVQQEYPELDWAFYLLGEEPPYNKQQLDWIWINHFHMNAVITHAQNSFDMAIAGSVKCCPTYAISGPQDTINSLAEFADIPLYVDVSMIFDHMVQKLAKHKALGAQA